YPEEDLSDATERLTLFLIQYWGGPPTYSEQRGHPRLRLRHQPFAIGQAERDAWLNHMSAAVSSLELAPAVSKARLDYCETASTKSGGAAAMPSTSTCAMSFSSAAIAQHVSLATPLNSPLSPIGRALGIRSSRLRTRSWASRKETCGSRTRASIARSATSSAA